MACSLFQRASFVCGWEVFRQTKSGVLLPCCPAAGRREGKRERGEECIAFRGELRPDPGCKLPAACRGPGGLLALLALPLAAEVSGSRARRGLHEQQEPFRPRRLVGKLNFVMRPRTRRRWLMRCLLRAAAPGRRAGGQQEGRSVGGQRSRGRKRLAGLYCRHPWCIAVMAAVAVEVSTAVVKANASGSCTLHALPCVGGVGGG